MGWLAELIDERGAEALDLHAQTINPQFVRLLRTIGFDRRWARAEGAYLWDAAGNRYLDVLGGFGMFNVGRNNPRVREALVEALELERPGSVQLGVDSLPALLADELLRRAPASVVREVRGLGLMWAIEFEEPEGGSRTWNLLERIQPALFAQLVVVPLFRDHHILSQVAGHGLNVLKAIPPLVVTEDDLEQFVGALEETVARAEKMPRALVRFAFQAARAGRTPKR